jgi:hypothetical protein
VLEFATLKRTQLGAVGNAVKERREVLKQQTVIPPPRFLSDEEKDALAKGNSNAITRANEKMYDYGLVAEKDLPNAQKWFKAPKPATVKGNTEYIAAYYQWRLWNVDGWVRYNGEGHHWEGDWEERFFTPQREGGGGGGGGG